MHSNIKCINNYLTVVLNYGFTLPALPGAFCTGSPLNIVSKLQPKSKKLMTGTNHVQQKLQV